MDINAHEQRAMNPQLRIAIFLLLQYRTRNLILVTMAWFRILRRRRLRNRNRRRRRRRNQKLVLDGERFSIHTFKQPYEIFFRFDRETLIECADRLFEGVQMKDIISNRYNPDKYEAFAMVCYRMISGHRYHECALLFNQHPSYICTVVNCCITFLYRRFRPLLYFDITRLTPEKLREFSLINQETLCSEGMVSPPSNIWGFIDGTFMQITRPLPSVSPQMEHYNGAKKHNGLNFQCVATPDGMISHVFGPISGSSNDVRLLRESNLEHFLEKLAIFEDGADHYNLYGDKAYVGRRIVKAPHKRPVGRALTRGRQRENNYMAKVRIIIENAFGDVSRYFSRQKSTTYNMRLGLTAIDEQFYVSILLRNLLIASEKRGSASIRGGVAPSMREYLSGWRTCYRFYHKALWEETFDAKEWLNNLSDEHLGIAGIYIEE